MPRRSGGVRAHLAFGCGRRQPGRLGVGEQTRDPARAVGAGADEQVVEVRDSPVGDPGLGPVDDVGVAVADGTAGQRSSVGARAWLGQAVRPQQLAAEQFGQPAVALPR